MNPVLVSWSTFLSFFSHWLPSNFVIFCIQIRRCCCVTFLLTGNLFWLVFGFFCFPGAFWSFGWSLQGFFLPFVFFFTQRWSWWGQRWRWALIWTWDFRLTWFGGWATWWRTWPSFFYFLVRVFTWTSSRIFCDGLRTRVFKVVFLFIFFFFNVWHLERCVAYLINNLQFFFGIPYLFGIFLH